MSISMSAGTENRIAYKRGRSSSCESDNADSELDFNERSRAWDDPTLLEEMGLGLLSEDSPPCMRGQSDQEILPISSEDDCTENLQITKKCEVKQPLKKRKVLDQNREPLKQQQQALIVSHMTGNDMHDVSKHSPHRRKDTEAAEIEAIKAPKCVKKSKAIRSEKKTGSAKLNNSTTDGICNDEFKLNSIPSLLKVSGKDYFSLLPDELILTIFRFLDRTSVVRCRQVSKQFLRVANDESFWMRIDLGGRKVVPGALGHLMKRGCCIVRLASTCMLDPVIEPNFLHNNFMSKIQYLDLSMASISTKGLATCLGYCNKIKKLSLENCAINEEVCSAIAQNTGIEVINFSMCSGISPVALTKLLLPLKKLQSINLAWTHLSLRSIEVLCRQIPSSVDRLNISGCRHNLSDQDVIDILKRCDNNLLELDMSDCIDLTERVIEYIVKNVKGLEYLAISRCYSIPLDCIPSLSKVRALSYLDLFGLCTDDELKELRATLSDKSLNQFLFSSVARPTVGVRRTSIWGLRVRD